jgi:hypothetical protein
MSNSDTDRPAGQKLSLREINDKIQQENAYEKVTPDALATMEQNLAAVKASKHIGKRLTAKSRQSDISHALQYVKDEVSFKSFNLTYSLITAAACTE